MTDCGAGCDVVGCMKGATTATARGSFPCIGINAHPIPCSFACRDEKMRSTQTESAFGLRVV